MDWYLIGRIFGVLAWPVAAAATVYVAGRLMIATRSAESRPALIVWVRLAAWLVYLVTLFATGLHLLRYWRLVD